MVFSLLVPWTSLPNLRLWLTSVWMLPPQRPKPALAEALTSMSVSRSVVVLMSISTSMTASENW